MTVVYNSDPLSYVPRGVARIAAVRENLDGEQPYGQPAPDAAGTEENFSVADLVNWTGQAHRVGFVHRSTGLQCAARTADFALRAAASAMRKGATDVAIAAVVEAAALAHGADRARCLVGMGHGTAVTHAYGAMYRPGQLVRLELNLFQQGFACHSQRIVLPATAAADLEAVEVCYEAREALLAQIGPGAAVAEVVAAGVRVLTDFGLLEHKEGTFGHWIGWGVTEPPFLTGDSSQTIRAGQLRARRACRCRRLGR
ncbi:M24 family metallopeptidase [Streptomyces olivaceoviridis]|uniref:M24 family metallopeptidase n=1 Tax=Streptomyces olivaceoviridis TaxID=1921 RepID=UPI00368D2A5D